LETFGILQLDPYHAPSHFNSGNVCLRQHSETGDASLLDKAIEHCKAAIAIDDKSVHAFVFMGEAYLRQGKEAEGMAALQDALKISPMFGGAHSILGTVLASKGRLKEVTDHSFVSASLARALFAKVSVLLRLPNI
jgi:tetratricopeptide (TPR) repeat protein